FTFGIDPAVVRTPGDPAGLIACANPNPTGVGARGFLTLPQPYRGKRVRLTAYLKTENVTRMAGIQLVATGDDSRDATADPFGMPPVRGTTDWTRCSAVIDVPANASTVQFAGALWGPGKVWMDDFRIEVVSPKQVHTTSDEK